MDLAAKADKAADLVSLVRADLVDKADLVAAKVVPVADSEWVNHADQ